MKKIIGAGIAAGIGVIGLTLVVPQAAYSAAPTHDGNRGNRYTMAQVATHNTAANCWTVVDKKVYDLTQWLVRYPTQPIAIPSLCGVDSTSAFNAFTVFSSDDDGDNDNDRSRRDRGGNDDGDNDGSHHGRGSASATASATATTLPAPSVSASASHDGEHGDNPWLKSIKRYRIGKLAMVASPSATGTSTATPSATATATPTATPTPTVTPTAPATFTLAQVAQHNTAANCWTAISSKVYDMSNYAASHPGGAGVITSLICGKDGTAAFTGQHAGASNPAAVLAGRLIGTLV